MKEQLLKELKAIVEAVKFTGNDSFDFSFDFNGEHYPLMNQQPYYQNYLPFNRFGENKQVNGKPEGKQNLITRLAGVLYTQCYCFPFANGKGKKIGAEKKHAAFPMPDKVDDMFINQLSKANQTREGWDYGWTIYNTDGQGQAFAQKNGQLMPLVPNEYQFSDPSRTTLQPQTPVHIKIKKENKQMMPGFYFVYSETVPDHTGGIARLYWNIKPEGAEKLVQWLSFSLNQYQIPFWFKCLNHPGLYRNRSDNAVLYVGKKYFKICGEIIMGLLPGLQDYLNPETPLFSKKLSRGLAFAEDPMDGSSFGQHRTGLLARALVEAFEKKLTGPSDILNQVDQVFKNHGIPLDTPYLNPNSHYQYHFSVFNGNV